MGFVFVGLGGAVGAMLRYAISMLPNKSEFPIWTLLTNLIGAIVIGFVVQYAQKRNVSEQMMLFLKTGVCGGFTTFSTFSLEAYILFQKQMWGQGSVYVICSVIVCLLGVCVGMAMANIIAK